MSLVEVNRGRSAVIRRLGVLVASSLTALGAVAAVAVASLGGDARPAPAPAGVHITPLSKGTIGSSVHAKNAGIEITTKGRKDLLITSITVDPGGSFGWHSHPGPVLVAVSKGTLAMYEAHGHGCPRSTVTAGQAFIEDGGHVHLARNEGSGPVELNAAFLARTGTTEFLTPEREPRGCDV